MAAALGAWALSPAGGAEASSADIVLSHLAGSGRVQAEAEKTPKLQVALHWRSAPRLAHKQP